MQTIVCFISPSQKQPREEANLTKREKPMSDIDKYREGYEDVKREIHEHKDDGIGNIPEQFVKGLFGLPCRALDDLTRSEAEEKGRNDAYEGKDFDPPKEEGSSGCFVSTACCEAMGLDDDCEELQTLRYFRDTYLLASSEGRKEVAAYYTHSPRVLLKIRSTKNSNEYLRYIFHELVGPTVNLIQKKEYAAAHAHYRAFVQNLIANSEAHEARHEHCSHTINSVV